MNGCEYVEKKYPESDFEDKVFTDDELYDGIAYAFDDGYLNGYNDAVERIKDWLKDFCYEVNVTNIRYGADVTETKVYTEFDTMQDMFDNLQEEIMEK